MRIRKVAIGIPTAVVSDLFVGSYECATDPEIVQGHSLRFILNVSDVAIETRIPGVQLDHIPVSDYGDTDLSSVLPACCRFIDQGRSQSKAVLVHCSLGINRSPTIVLGYLVSRLGWSLRQSYQLLHRRRSFIWPHDRYIRQLCDLELETHSVASITPAEIADEFPARATLQR